MIVHGMKTYRESRIQMQIHCKFTNLKMLEKSRQILSSEQPCEPKDVVFNTEGVERI